MSDPTHSGPDSAHATHRVARAICELRYENLPGELVALLKKCVLDTLGVTIAASGLAEEALIAAGHVRDMGGKPESTIFGFGDRAPAAWAAFVNGGLGHMLDYDDVGAGHPAIATLPPALAVAERQGGVSGRDLLTALACGTDVMARMDDAVDVPEWTASEGWFATQLFGFIAGAAAAGKIMSLSLPQMENALGIAFNQSSGSRQMAVGASTHMRSMQAGFSGQGAVLAVELARRGMSGSREFLEGRYGLFRTYIRTREPDWDALTGGLGERFPLLRKHGFKVWPACHFTRPTNTAILHLRSLHALQPADIEAITIIGGHANTRQLCEPIEFKRKPRSAIDGKFSIPFTSAVMMAKGNVTLRDYTDEGLNDPEVLAMAERVHYRPAAEGDPDAAFPEVEIRTRDMRTFRSRPDTLMGDWNHPVDQHFLDAKFRDCVSFARLPIPLANIERAMQLIGDLEHVEDVTQIVRLLSP